MYASEITIPDPTTNTRCHFRRTRVPSAGITDVVGESPKCEDRLAKVDVFIFDVLGLSHTKASDLDRFYQARDVRVPALLRASTNEVPPEVRGSVPRLLKTEQAVMQWDADDERYFIEFFPPVRFFQYGRRTVR